VAARRALLTPATVNVDGRPCVVADTGIHRGTPGQYESGAQSVFRYYWKASRKPHIVLPKKPWGTTTFVHDVPET